MAEEVLYQSGPDSAAKRKHEDSTALAPTSSVRRVSGFSAASLSSPDPAPLYNSVPPPMDEIQLAKQRAQEIAARLFNNAEAKRPKFENGGGGFDSNDSIDFSSGPTDLGQKPMFTPSVPSSYGYGGPSKKMEIPNGRVGVIIGKAGETIKYLQLQSGAKIQVTRDTDSDPHSLTRQVELTGSADSIAHAEQLIKDVLAEAESGGSGIVSRRVSGQPGGAEQFSMKIPTNKVGLVIGKGGETIKNMQASTGARIQVIPLHPPPGDTSTERTVQIDGSSDQIEAAKQLVNEVISSENRQRNSIAGGGYSQQGYQARPPTSWAPPGPGPGPQQGYGYTQPPGSYPPAQPYAAAAAYPQQTSGGYAVGWDQSAQQTAGYDYYGQQQTAATQPPGAPGGSDTSAYGYSQQVQGYGQQDGGYGGYGSAPPSGYGYGNPGATQTPDDASQAPPSSGYAQPPSYGVPPVSQAQPGYGGYGPPATQKAPVSQAGGGGGVQSGYGYSGGYGQADGGGQRGLPSYGATPGYGQPPAAGYGGQQAAAYGGSYGSGYPQQASGYSSDVGAQAVPKASPQQN